MIYPNIYQIEANFFDQLALGILDRFKAICKVKEVTVILPTNHACHSLREAFLALDSQGPQIYSISDLSAIVKLQTELVPLDQIGLITQISQIIASIDDSINFNTDLAEYYAKFINLAQLHQIDLDNVIKIIEDDLTLHQQQLFQMLKRFILIWQQKKFITKSGYNNLLIDQLKRPNLVIAGLNSNIPAIYKLIARTINKPNSYVILYGLDNNLNQKDWENIEVTHGQYSFKKLLAKLEINPQSIKSWHEKLAINNQFISASLKPAKSCGNWYEQSNLSLNNLKYLGFPDQHQEAKAIVNLLQQKQYQKAMIVVADDELMVKIMFHLKSLNIDANIIRDHPLQECSKALWFKLCLHFILEKFSLVSGLALLKHPFMGMSAELLQELELLLRDKNFREDNIFAVITEDEELKEILAKLAREAKIFKHLFENNNISFLALLKNHINFADKFVVNLNEESELEKAFNDFLKQLQANENLDIDIDPADYPKILNYFLKLAYYRAPLNNNNITLAKPIDARLHSADLVIIAGLNENIWPAKPATDPCFNNQLLSKINLPIPEENIGEEAYDFQCFAQGKQVIITRSEKIKGSETIASRWLLRILTLAKKLDSMEEISLLPIVEASSESSEYPEDFPPTPPLEYRPQKFSVTQIEKLVFNPYHIYVDLVLGLKKLQPLAKELTPADFGNFIHQALVFYHHGREKNLTGFLVAGKQALVELGLSQLQILWWPRFIRIAKWVIENQDNSNKAYLETYGAIDFGGSNIKARADRIEVSPNNKIQIIDYKTGRLPSAKSIYNGESLQLLLEGMIAENAGFNFQKQGANIISRVIPDERTEGSGDRGYPADKLMISPVFSANALSPGIRSNTIVNHEKRYKVAAIKYIQLSGGEETAEILAIDLLEKPLIAQTQEYLENLLKLYQQPETPYYYTSKKTLGYCEYEHLARKF